MEISDEFRFGNPPPPPPSKERINNFPAFFKTERILFVVAGASMANLRVPPIYVTTGISLKAFCFP